MTGSLKYSADIKLPGMLAGKIIRPEAYNADLVSYDARRGRAAWRRVKIVRY